MFKKLFRRMMGIQTWPLEDSNIPHNPQWNGLKYLYDYSHEHASQILSNPNWTRALFVRDPLERVLSAFLDKAARQNGTYLKRHCCGMKGDDTMSFHDRERHQLTKVQFVRRHFLKGSTSTYSRNSTQRRRLQDQNKLHSNVSLLAMMTPGPHRSYPQSVPAGGRLPAACAYLNWATGLISWEDFISDFLPSCSNDAHWKTQVSPSLRWINFVGNFCNLQTDTKRLLQKVGAWEKYGASGWPGPIFQENSAGHKTSSKQIMARYYGNHELRAVVLHLYQKDYEHPLLNLSTHDFHWLRSKGRET